MKLVTCIFGVIFVWYCISTAIATIAIIERFNLFGLAS